MAVFVEEIHPPRGEEAVQWMLLTTHEVQNKNDALRIVKLYRLRWTIEGVLQNKHRKEVRHELTEHVKAA
jgi:hypothetical protein